MNKSGITISYLAPELTAMESTYVYEELLSIESLGYNVIPVSIRRPARPTSTRGNLDLRTYYLYESNLISTLLKSLIACCKYKNLNRIQGLKLVFSDMKKLGIFNIQSWKLFYQYFVAFRLVEILIQNNCCHLHVHFAHVPAQIGMYASSISKIPFTIMAHANDIFERGLLLTEKAERTLKFLTISEYNRQYLEQLGIDSAKLAIVRCGVSFRKPSEISNKITHQNLFKIGTLGRLVEKKGVDILIHAIAKLNNENYRCHLSIAGDGPLLNELKTLVNNLQLQDLVNFEGAIAHNEVSDWLQSLSVFVLACKTDSNGDKDGIPVVLMEAMSQAVPVISTRLSGIPELVIHGKTGLLAEPDNVDDLAYQMKQLLSSKSLQEDLVKAGQAHVYEEFSQQVNVERLIKFFPPLT